MPSIRLTFPQPWYDSIRRVAEGSHQTIEQLLRGLIALSIAPSSRSGSSSLPGRLPQEQALIDRVGDLCRELDATRNQLAGALLALAQEPPRTRLQAERAESGTRLRAAMKRKGVTHARLASRIGVARAFVTGVVNGKKSLPPAWMADLNAFFGEGWFDERVGD